MSKVSENIKRLRLEKGLKQSELATMLEKSHNVISSWEAETNRPDVDSIAKMCKIFEVDANTLFGWEDSKRGDDFTDPALGNKIAPTPDAHTDVFTVNDDGKVVELSQAELSDVYKRMAELPSEAFGEIGYFIDLLKYKYIK